MQLALECLSIPNIASSPSTWIMQGAALPLSFFLQPLTRFKRQQKRPFHLISLRKNKAGRLQEGENLVSKSPSGLSLGRSPSQGYLLYNTGKSLTIESLVQSLGNNVTIFLWQSTTNISSSSSKFMEKDPRCTMGGFLFIFSFPEPKEMPCKCQVALGTFRDAISWVFYTHSM